MLITLKNKKINFLEAQSLSVDEGVLTFQMPEGEETIQLTGQSRELIDEIADYIVSCYQRGFKKLNLERFIKE